MNRRSFLKHTASSLMASSLAIKSLYGTSHSKKRKPNILFLLADDMGYSDAGCYGGDIATPNLNHLADNGIRFTQFYNTGRCWPSRASLLTGYFAQQVRRDNLPGKKGHGKRQKWATLLPERLKPLNYRSYHSGKWHIDGTPLEGGFDLSYCLNDHDRYFSPQKHLLNDEKLPPVATESDYYATTAIADHAIKCLKDHSQKHQDQPFFSYVAFTSPHFPLHALQKDIDRYRKNYLQGWDSNRKHRFERLKKLGIVECQLSMRDAKTIPSWNLPEETLEQKIGKCEVGYAVAWNSLTDEEKEFQATKMAIHAAMIDRMDQEIGRIMEQIQKMRVLDNTVIMFASDNGASAEQIVRGDNHDRSAPLGSAHSYLCLGPGWSTAANTPFRLHKSWVHEGGIATPFIVSWPKGINAHGQLRHDPTHLIDVAPTIMELAGGKWPEDYVGKPMPDSPGISLVPAFEQDGAIKHDYLFWLHNNNRAIRVGKWKLVAQKNKTWELFDLNSDRSETKNLANEYPDKVKELTNLWDRCVEEYKTLW